MNKLQTEAAYYSRVQIASGSPFYFVNQDRNNYRAIDLYRIEQDGSKMCVSNLEAGSFKKCVQSMDRYTDVYPGYKYPFKQLTREQAVTAVQIAGVDLHADFYTLSASDVEILVTWAKLTRYRKPKNANGSTGRYFFANLQRTLRKMECAK